MWVSVSASVRRSWAGLDADSTYEPAVGLRALAMLWVFWFHGVSTTLPDLGGYLAGLSGLMSATLAAPSVDALDGTWTALNASLNLVPPFAVTQAPLATYEAEQARLPHFPSGFLMVTADDRCR